MSSACDRDCPSSRESNAKRLDHGCQSRPRVEFARQYLADGWQVYAACRDPNSASKLSRLVDASAHKLRILALNVTDSASVKAAAAELDGQAIDLLLNNAGVGGARGQTLGKIDYEAWAEVFDVSAMGPMRVSDAFVN